MTFGRAPSDDAPFTGWATGPSARALDAPYGSPAADGFGARGPRPDGFGGAAVQLRRTPHRAASAPAVTPATSTTPATPVDAVGAALLRSAATDLENLRVRATPAAGLLPGFGLAPAALARELEVIVRRIDEATSAGAASLRPDEIENVAGAARALAASLPAAQRQAPEVQDALGTLMVAVGEVATAGHHQPSLEPTVSQPALGDAAQVQLARLLLGQASATLDEVAGAPPGPDERRQYARAAADAASKVQVAADLIAAHVPPGKARVALAGLTDGVSARIAQVDQWVRAAKVSSDPAIATLYRSERALRELVGLEAARRTPLETLDAETTAASLTAAPAGPAHGGSVGHVRAALGGVLRAMDDAIDTFDAGADHGAKPPPSLTDQLVDLAVETALGSSLEGAFKRAILATGRALVGSEDEDELPGQLLDLAWQRGKHALTSGGRHAPSERHLRKRYVELLRQRLRTSTDAIAQAFEDQAERLGRAAPASLRAVADQMMARADAAGTESLLQYVLSWQSLQARVHQGTPEQPSYDRPETRPTPSEHDAALTPAFTAGVPGVLHVDFPLVALAPRASQLREHAGRIDGITPDHLRAIQRAEARPLRELHLNTAIRVTYGDSDGGGVEVLWFPDGGTVKVNWERMDHARQSLGDARHLQAYARGVPVDHPSLAQATEADALEGARLIAEAVGSTPSNKVFRFVKTPLVAIAVLATFAGCRDPKPGSPFTTIATPELRAIFTKLCADPVTGSDTPTEWHDPGGDLAIAQSSGYGCSVRLHYDQQDLHITWIYMGAGLDWARFRNFVRGTIEPIVKPPIRAFLEQKVLADLGVDKRVTYSKHGVGEVDYRNRTRDSVDPDLRPTREPMLYLTIAWK